MPTRTSRKPLAASPAAPEASGAEPSVRVLRRFRVVFNAVKSHFQQVERKAGVGGAQLWALSLVAARPGLGVGELARSMDIHQTTASNLVRSLVERDLVRTGRSESDRRMVQLHLQPAGQRLLRQAPGPFSGVLPAALARMEPATLARLDHDLGVLIELLQADERAAGIPLGQM